MARCRQSSYSRSKNLAREDKVSNTTNIVYTTLGNTRNPINVVGIQHVPDTPAEPQNLKPDDVTPDTSEEGDGPEELAVTDDFKTKPITVYLAAASWSTLQDLKPLIHLRLEYLRYCSVRAPFWINNFAAHLNTNCTDYDVYPCSQPVTRWDLVLDLRELAKVCFYRHFKRVLEEHFVNREGQDVNIDESMFLAEMCILSPTLLQDALLKLKLPKDDYDDASFLASRANERKLQGKSNCY